MTVYPAWSIHAFYYHQGGKDTPKKMGSTRAYIPKTRNPRMKSDFALDKSFFFRHCFIIKVRNTHVRMSVEVKTRVITRSEIPRT